MADEKEYQENRISQQCLLLSYCDELQRSFYDSYSNKQGTKLNPVLVLEDDLSLSAYGQSDQFKNTPHNIKVRRESDVGQIYYSYEDLNIFLNSLDPLSLSMLQPYIRFIKVHKGKRYVLDLEDANRASLKAFISGARGGKGTIGSGRETAGGFGIKDFDLEYVVNKESGYLFNLYKIHAEFFFGSQEDLQANIGHDGDSYSPLDVLIAFPDDVKRFQMAPGLVDESDVSSAYRVEIEVGYNVDTFTDMDPDRKKSVVREEYFNILKRNNKIDFNKFKEVIEKMRFKINAQVYKWDPKFTENGNILFKFDFYGYDRGIGVHPASNIALPNKSLDELNRLSKSEQSATKEGQSKKEQTDAQNAAKSATDSERSRLKEISLKFPFLISQLAKTNWKFKIEAAALTGGVDTFSFFAKDEIKREHFLLPEQETMFLYDFKAILNDETRGKQTTVGKRGSFEDPNAPPPSEYNQENTDIPAVEIPYFYLGDLLSYISYMATINLTQQVSMKGEPNGNSSYLPKGSFVEFVVGKIVLQLPQQVAVGKYKKEINLAAVPIAWDIFLDWWYKQINARPNLIYKLEEFLQDFFGYFFNSMLMSKDDFHLSDIQIGSHCVVYPLSANPNGPKKLSYYLYMNNMQDRKPIRFFVGNRRGVMKSVEFSVEEDQHLNSYMMASAVEGQLPDNNLQTQRAMYNVNMELFGNAILQPGMLIEVVPTIVGAQLQKQNNFKNLYDLGIGGLYNVVSTKVSLKDGAFNTSIHAKYYGKPMQGAGALSEFMLGLSQSQTAQALVNYFKNPLFSVVTDMYKDPISWEKGGTIYEDYQAPQSKVGSGFYDNPAPVTQKPPKAPENYY